MDQLVRSMILSSGTITGNEMQVNNSTAKCKITIDWVQYSITGINNKTLVNAQLYVTYSSMWSTGYIYQQGTYLAINGVTTNLDTQKNITTSSGKMLVIDTSVEVEGHLSSIEISGNCLVGLSSGVSDDTNILASGNAGINSIVGIPSTPQNFIMSGFYEHEGISVSSWDPVIGAESYELEVRYLETPPNTFTAWNFASSTTNTEITSTFYNNYVRSKYAVQKRIKAVNKAGSSGWAESNIIYHYGIKMYSESSWYKKFGKLKVYINNNWKEELFVRIWDGINWVTPNM